MTEIVRRRIGTFLGILVVCAIAVRLVAWQLDISPITLAPGYMFTPLIAGIAVCLHSGIGVRTVGLQLGRPKWLVVAALSALALVVLTLLLAVIVPGVTVDSGVEPLPGLAVPPGLPGLGLVLGIILVAGTTINAVFAFGEEFGWRGYLLWELAPLGFWRASALIGIIWGIWHSPIILAGYNFPSFPVVGVGVMTLACCAFSPLYTYLVLRARSVIAAALVHGVFNASAGLVLVYASGRTAVLEELVANAVGAAGIAAFLLVSIGIAVTGVPTLSRTELTAR
ncbi:MAG: CPBP family intramembrane glutamic endopeptidase [Natrialbaceae archaeon]|nr:CPBP family intramembrane glutamic endopeptidase [Natrialbaceae archaeon]